MAVKTQARFDTAAVRRYYDRHTGAFVRHGQGGGSIHRAVWGPGVSSRRQAFHYVEERIGELVPLVSPSTRPPHVVDLGCGVGASLCYLAARLPIRGTGVTLSSAQAEMARERIAASGLGDRLTCIEGDYCDLPPTVATADLAFAIESFVHGPSPEQFFEQCRRLVRPGGLLVICDDVRRKVETPEAQQVLDAFTQGWHVNTLIGRHALVRLARDAEFDLESTTDLTPLLELQRLRDRVIGACLWVGRRVGVGAGRWAHLAGGHALQTCLARGWVGYELSVFRRR
jgi:tocopherol O-methyltransferase